MNLKNLFKRKPKPRVEAFTVLVPEQNRYEFCELYDAANKEPGTRRRLSLWDFVDGITFQKRKEFTDSNPWSKSYDAKIKFVNAHPRIELTFKEDEPR